MYSDWVVLLGLTVAATFIWLGILSYLIWQQNVFLKSLFPKSGERDIRKKFAEVLELIEEFGSDLDRLKLKLKEVESLGLQHIQKVELLRFNPYDDTGGDQSFTCALLNGKGSGVVITSLHARGGTRIFAKPVVEGKPDKHELSKEEKEVVKRALIN